MKAQYRRTTSFWPVLVILLSLFGGRFALAASPIVSGETHSGDISSPSQMDMYEFHGTAGNRIMIDVDRTGGNAWFDTEILLIDPDFENETNTQPGGDLLDHVLLKTGTYTIFVQDTDLNDYGSYNITLLNLTAGPLTSSADPNGGPIVSGETLNGEYIDSDLDAFQFYGTAGDRIMIDVDRTGGNAWFDTEILLIDPDFENETNTQPGGDLLDHVLLKTGTYIILVQDADLNDYGSYNITLLKSSGAPSSPGDCNGGLIHPGEILSGEIIISDMDAFLFYGTAGDRVMIDADRNGGDANFDTEILLIDPGNQDEANTQPGGDFLDHFLFKSGLYAIIVQDVGLNNTGSYNLTLNKLPGTPRPGIYNPDPSSTCGVSNNPTLTWDAVTGATAYDVFFGTNVVEPLEKVGNNISGTSFPVSGLNDSTIYYWTVVAHTPSGDIPGTVNWFGTHFKGDFEPDGDVDGSDLAVFAADFGRTDCDTGPPCEGDFDKDNDVDGSDLATFAADFGRTDCP